MPGNSLPPVSSSRRREVPRIAPSAAATSLRGSSSFSALPIIAASARAGTSRNVSSTAALSLPHSVETVSLPRLLSNASSEFFQADLDVALERWVNRAPRIEVEGRREASRRIRDCHRNENYFLDLSGLGLSDIKGIVFPSCVQELNLRENQISTVKGGVLPSSLLSLDLGKNQISDVRGWTLPSSLEKLYLDHNSIEDLREWDFPISLLGLDLSGNQITHISQWRLPQFLEQLDLSQNPISRIRDWTPPPFLLGIYLDFCPIRSLQGCRFHEGLTVRNMPAFILQDLGAVIVERPRVTRIRTELEYLIRDFSVHRKKYRVFLEHKYSPALAAFLQRMRIEWPQYKWDIIDYLNLSLSDPNFFESLFEEIQAAATNCRDRPLYFFSRLSVIAAFYKAKQENKREEMGKSLLALHSMQLIEQKAYTIFAKEALEIALYFQLKLKGVLSLPINIRSMKHEEYARKLIGSQISIDAMAEECKRAQETKDQKIQIICASEYFQKEESHLIKDIFEKYSDALTFLLYPENQRKEFSDDIQTLAKTFLPVGAVMEELTSQELQSAQERLQKELENEKRKRLESVAESFI